MTKLWKVEVVETDVQQDKDHHVHILVKACPQVAPYEIIHKIKQITTFDMWKQHNEYLKRFFWTGEHNLWTRGYFCSSVGDVSEMTLKRYIEN